MNDSRSIKVNSEKKKINFTKKSNTFLIYYSKYADITNVQNDNLGAIK